MTNDPMHQCTEVQSAEPQPLHKARRCGARTRSGRPIDAPWPFEVRSETDKAKSPEAHDQTREFPPSRAGLISALGQASLRPTKQKPPGGSSGHAEQVARPTCAHPAVGRPVGSASAHGLVHTRPAHPLAHLAHLRRSPTTARRIAHERAADRMPEDFTVRECCGARTRSGRPCRSPDATDERYMSATERGSTGV